MRGLSKHELFSGLPAFHRPSAGAGHASRPGRRLTGVFLVLVTNGNVMVSGQSGLVHSQSLTSPAPPLPPRLSPRLPQAPEVERCPLKAQPDDNKDNPSLAYTTAADIWSVGVLAFEMLCGFPPFASPDPYSDENCDLLQTDDELLQQALEENAERHRQLHYPHFVSPGARDFIALCLAERSNDRPPAEQLLRHPWLRSNVISHNDKARRSLQVSGPRLPQRFPTDTMLHSWLLLPAVRCRVTFVSCLLSWHRRRAHGKLHCRRRQAGQLRPYSPRGAHHLQLMRAAATAQRLSRPPDPRYLPSLPSSMTHKLHSLWPRCCCTCFPPLPRFSRATRPTHRLCKATPGCRAGATPACSGLACDGRASGSLACGSLARSLIA